MFPPSGMNDVEKRSVEIRRAFYGMRVGREKRPSRVFFQKLFFAEQADEIIE